MIVVEHGKNLLTRLEGRMAPFDSFYYLGKARQTLRSFIKSAASKPLFGGEALLIRVPTPSLLRCESFRGTCAFLRELKEGN